MRGMLVGLIASVAACGSARADTAGDCEPVFLPGPELALARVGGAARTTFVKNASEMPGCPAGVPACRGKAFIVPGDLVIIGRAQGPFTCAGYIGRTGQHRGGWLPTADLVRLPPAAVTSRDWIGRWDAYEAQVTIKAAAAGKLLVDGYATSGSHDPERVRLGGVNVGEFTVQVVPEHDTIAFTTDFDGKAVPVDQGRDGCTVTLRRLGPYLLGRDNNQCGGVGVTFDGVYRRTR